MTLFITPSLQPIESASSRACRRYAAAARRCSTRRERCHCAYYLPDAHNNQCQDSALARAANAPPLDKVIPPAKGITLPGGKLRCFGKIMLLRSQQAVERTSTFEQHQCSSRASQG